MRDDLGSRLVFLRDKLNLSAKGIYEPLHIPPRTYYNLEHGHKTTNHNILLDISNFLNFKWQEKYRKFRNYPKAYDQSLEEITVSWLLFGFDHVLDRTNKFLKRVTDDFREREIEFFEIKQQLLSMLEKVE